MNLSALYEFGSSAQKKSLAWLLAPICQEERPAVGLDEVFAPSWQSREMARYAAEMTASLAGSCRIEELRRTSDMDAGIRCLLKDSRGRDHELLLTFESENSGLLTRFCVRPVLAAGVEVRQPRLQDLPAMTQLELSAPVRREDGTEVVIDHNGKQFEHASIVSDHRWLAAFQGGQMVAVQGVALATAPIGGAMCRIAYNHYSRSDPQARHSGNLIHLVSSLYRDIYPTIDQFLSIVDVQNRSGLRLSFGTPWPSRVRRLFLSAAALAARGCPMPVPRSFDPAHAAALLNATHARMNLWVPRTDAFLLERQRRAPAVYTAACWRLTDHAALALWPSGERRTYRSGGSESVRTLALALDYGFTGEAGRGELLGLLCQAAGEVLRQGVSHIALFVSDDHPPTRWLMDLAEAVDTYAVCAPALERPAPPSGPTYIDHIIF